MLSRLLISIRNAVLGPELATALRRNEAAVDRLDRAIREALER